MNDFLIFLFIYIYKYMIYSFGKIIMRHHTNLIKIDYKIKKKYKKIHK